MSRYPFASGNLIEHPNTYFYTPYEGVAFLDAWRASRHQVLATLGCDAADPKAGKAPSLQEMLDRMEHTAFMDAGALLDALRAAISQGDERPMARRLTRALVKRFEVTKKVHASYDRRFRPEDGAGVLELAHYVRAAEVFEAAYGSWRELPCLNALIKCLDTVCAMSDGLASDWRPRLAHLILRERQHVNELATVTGWQA